MQCVVSEKISARRPCGGRKRSTSNQTDDSVCHTVKTFHDKPLRAIQKQHLPDISRPLCTRDKKSFCFVSEKPIEKPYLNVRHRHLRLQFVQEFLEIPVSFWRSIYFADQSLFKNTVTKESQRVICGARFAKSYPKRRLNFKHLTQLFIWCSIKAGHPFVWRQIDSADFVNTLKEAFQIDPDHRIRSDVPIL